MNKPLITSGIIILILFLLLLAVMFPFLSEVKGHHPAASEKINDYLTAINSGASNLYIISNADTKICIDAGSDLKRVSREFSKMKIDPDSIKAVFLTHSDQDHVTALGLFHNAKIYLSKAEEEMVQNRQRHLFGFIENKLPNTYSTLNDGSELNIDNIKIKAIATPGHTSGSTSYLVNDRMLFTGDTLSLIKNKALLFTPHVFNMDEKKQQYSIRKLKSLKNIEFLCTGHHGITKDFQTAINEW